MPQNQPSLVARILWFLLATLFIIVCSVGATLLVMHYTGPVRDGDHSAAEPPHPSAQQPIFAELDPFTVTLNDDYPSRVLYVGITLRLDDQASATLIQKHMPEVRDRALQLLATQDARHIQTAEGRAALAASLGSALLAPYAPAARGPQIKDVFFTAFVIQ